LIFLSSVSWSFLPNGARAEVSVDVGLSLCAGGEATRDDAGSSDEFPQRFFIGIGDHKALQSGIEGVGGAVDDAKTVELEAPTPLEAVAPPAAGLTPAANPLNPAKAAPVATAPALTSANAVEPTFKSVVHNDFPDTDSWGLKGYALAL
jgi:hypothetical protein